MWNATSLVQVRIIVAFSPMVNLLTASVIWKRRVNSEKSRDKCEKRLHENIFKRIRLSVTGKGQVRRSNFGASETVLLYIRTIGYLFRLLKKKITPSHPDLKPVWKIPIKWVVFFLDHVSDFSFSMNSLSLHPVFFSDKFVRDISTQHEIWIGDNYFTVFPPPRYG